MKTDAAFAGVLFEIRGDVTETDAHGFFPLWVVLISAAVCDQSCYVAQADFRAS